MKNKFMNAMVEEHEGFAITLEVIATLAIMTTFMIMTLYVLKVMNVQRYMNTVMTSTAAQASRWGGTDTKAYRANVANERLLSVAQGQLNMIAPDFNPIITGSPTVISKNGDLITVTIKYSMPPVFKSYSKVVSPSGSVDMYNATRNLSMTVRVRSIMEAGKLL